MINGAPVLLRLQERGQNCRSDCRYRPGPSARSPRWRAPEPLSRSSAGGRYPPEPAASGRLGLHGDQRRGVSDDVVNLPGDLVAQRCVVRGPAARRRQRLADWWRCVLFPGPRRWRRWRGGLRHVPGPEESRTTPIIPIPVHAPSVRPTTTAMALGVSPDSPHRPAAYRDDDRRIRGQPRRQ